MPDAVYHFGPELTFHQAREVREELLQAVEQGILRFDLGRVESFDSAGAQLLVALIKTVAARGQGVEWEQLSIEVSQGLTELGLQTLTAVHSPITRTAP